MSARRPGATLAPREAELRTDADTIVGDRARDAESSVLSYFDTFAPAPEWDELVTWPPDVFTLANLVLDHTEAYRFVVAPPAGRRWPPLPRWDARVHEAALGWKNEVPALVRRYWDVVTRFREVPLADVRSGAAWELTGALLTLHATADEACADVAARGRDARGDSLESRAWQLLQERGSLARLSSTRVRVVPKTSFSTHGITIRSLSRHLALCYESVDVRWRSSESGLPPADRQDYNVVLVPWPLAVSSRDFRPVPPDLLENMDTDRFGFFEFAPEPSVDHDVAASLLDEAREQAGHVDTVILPEVALRAEDVTVFEQVLAEQGATFLIAGVQEPPPADSPFGRNYLHFGVRTSAGWNRYEQDKHHRWCLDESQIRQYHLSRSLDPGKRWWEAIDIRERTLHVIDVGGGVTAAPMVCEDLARLDEVADLVRRIGPSLVVAVLLDGPQLATRWSCRYSSVLADDPGSAVLTLTPYGMVARSRPPGTRPSRVVAHWNSQRGGLREIELAPRARAILLTTSLASRTQWTADGRCHEVPGLALTGVHQLRGTTGRPVAR